MNLFVGVAPERNAELSDLWQRYTPRFNFIMDNGPDGAFVMEAGLYREVRFNDRAMRAFWLAAFIGWEGYRSVHEGLVRNDFQLTRFNEMIDCFTELLNADDPLTVTLPEGVPDPGVYVDGTLNRTQRQQQTWQRLRAVGHFFMKFDTSSTSRIRPARLTMLHLSNGAGKNCPAMNSQRASSWITWRIMPRGQRSQRMV